MCKKWSAAVFTQLSARVTNKQTDRQGVKDRGREREKSGREKRDRERA